MSVSLCAIPNHGIGRGNWLVIGPEGLIIRDGFITQSDAMEFIFQTLREAIR